MSGPGEAPELPSELSAFDLLMHRGEANPRTRSGIMALEILDSAPDWREFRNRFDNASRKALRLRQRVVVPTLPVAPARWVVDPTSTSTSTCAGSGCLNPERCARCSTSPR